MEMVVAKNPGEKEFQQAVREVMESLWEFLIQHPVYFESRVLERLIEPERVVIFRVPWINDDGDIEVNRGYRVEFNSAIGPYKGGLRFHPSVTLSILKFLGFEQVFKNSLTTLPMGGGKGGSDFDPKGKSDKEVMRFCQSFMTELSRHIGPDTDIPAGDIGVGGREIGFLFGQYKRLRNEFTGVLTGKALSWGGSVMRPEATGYGVVYFAEAMLARQNNSIDGKKVAISGSGNVAQYAAEKVLEFNGQVITLSDSNGTVYDPSGIDREKLEYVKYLKNEERGRIKKYAEKYRVQYWENQCPWKAKCDVALPCATQNEIDSSDADRLIENGCICVAEGANMPSTSGAVERFLKAKILYGPGKAANAGGVSVSGLEMAQNSMRMQWPASEVDEKLQYIMQSIHSQCVLCGQERNFVNYVKGSNIAGFIKVANAMLAQGVV